jgi:quercetin dioxygenase-like cupin family protein
MTENPKSDTTSGGLELTHDMLAAPPMHIPDGKGGAYKTELVVERVPDRTVKILWWYADDPRTEPHNHPWAFTSERYRVASDGTIDHETVVVRAGDVNVVPADVYHRVTDVLPGTVTRMTCGTAAQGNAWGYLDIVSGKVSSSEDPMFVENLRALNPHLRPSG